MSWEFLDGDDFHGQEQVKKMASGIPLTEQDRELWLEVLRELLQAEIIDESIRNTSIAGERFENRHLEKSG